MVVRMLQTSLAAALVVMGVAIGQDDGAFQVGPPLDTSERAQVYGGFHFAESCSYDAERNLFIVPSAGARNGEDNDGYVSLVNPDGTLHTPKWIGGSRDGLTLNQPFGSDIMGGSLYLADLNTVRWFDVATGEPQGSVTVEDATWLNDLEVAEDGTIYASQTGTQDGEAPQRIYRISPDGTSSVFAEGEPLARPNGLAFDIEGNIVVVNIGSNAILTFSPEGELLETQQSLDSVNDGLVILEDGTMYVSSVGQGTVARIPPDGEPERVASGIPSAASICYDLNQNRILVPMNANNAVALVDLE